MSSDITPDTGARGGRIHTVLRAFLANGAAGGLVLMAAAVLALVVANSSLAPAYFGALKAYVGPLSVLHWINEGLMAVFFLLVGLEIKREMLDGQLRTWPDRALPGIAALGGMLVPALIYVALNWKTPETLRGWAIPSATDIAFALGVLSLLGPGEPEASECALIRLEHVVQPWVAYLIVPVFGFANAGVSFAGISASALTQPVLLGIAAGLLLGKQLGVFAFAWGAIRLRLADVPANATWAQVYGVAILCGIGFTMSLFIGLLAFPDAPALQDEVKIGVLAGSVFSALSGAALLRMTRPEREREAAPANVRA